MTKSEFFQLCDKHATPTAEVHVRAPANANRLLVKMQCRADVVSYSEPIIQSVNNKSFGMTTKQDRLRAEGIAARYTGWLEEWKRSHVAGVTPVEPAAPKGCTSAEAKELNEAFAKSFEAELPAGRGSINDDLLSMIKAPGVSVPSEREGCTSAAAKELNERWVKAFGTEDQADAFGERNQLLQELVPGFKKGAGPDLSKLPWSTVHLEDLRRMRLFTKPPIRLKVTLPPPRIRGLPCDFGTIDELGPGDVCQQASSNDCEVIPPAPVTCSKSALLAAAATTAKNPEVAQLLEQLRQRLREVTQRWKELSASPWDTWMVELLSQIPRVTGAVPPFNVTVDFEDAESRTVVTRVTVDENGEVHITDMTVMPGAAGPEGEEHDKG